MAGTDATTPAKPVLTVPLDMPSAQLLADQAAIIQDLQFVMESCKRLLTELGNGHTFTVKVPTGIDAVVGEPAFLSWSAANCRAFPVSTAAERELKQETLNKEWRNS